MSMTVSVSQCKSYQREEVQSALVKVLDPFGGIRAFVRPGNRVLLKPNMVSSKPPETGIITHPAVVEAVICLVQRAGGSVLIGDSPSGVVKGVAGYWKSSGYGALAEQYHASLVAFEKTGTVKKEMHGRIYHIAKAVFDADVVINLPKLKTHGLTLFTGAVKNLYGTLTGFQKANNHKLYPNPTHFSRVVAEIYGCIKPQLHILDGIVSMEGNGPATGELRRTGLLFASSDGVALDSIVTQLIGFDENEVDAIRFAYEFGFGESRRNKIQLVGGDFDHLKIENFHLPSNRLLKWIPQWMMRWVGRFVWIKPVPRHDVCSGCGVCSTSCPVSAIRIINKKAVMDYQLCINCLCCNESCPEGAIYQKMSRLARLFS